MRWEIFFSLVVIGRRVSQRAAATESSSSSTARKNLVFVRIQKTGSKSLVTVLEQCSFTMCPKRPVDAVDSAACAKNLRNNMLKNGRSSSSSHQYNCYVASHCGLATFEHVFNNTLPPPPSSTRRRGRNNKFPLRSRVVLPDHPLPIRSTFVITILRHPVARVVSEYRHVCAKGRGQWDYSTKEWRVNRARNLSLPAPDTSDRHAAFVVDCDQAPALASFAQAPAHANGMRNRQMRMLAGAVLEVGHTDTRSELELYHKARVALSTVVDFALVFEKFHASLIVLSKKIGLDPPRHFSIVSEAIEKAPKPVLNPDTTRIILDLNKFDELLHEQALLKLEEEQLALGSGPFYACEKQGADSASSNAMTTVVFTTQEKRDLHYYEAARCRLLSNETLSRSNSAAMNSESERQRSACESRLLQSQVRIQMQERLRHRRQQWNATNVKQKRMPRENKGTPASSMRKKSRLRQGERPTGSHSPKHLRPAKRPNDQATSSQYDMIRRGRSLRNRVRHREDTRSRVR